MAHQTARYTAKEPNLGAHVNQFSTLPVVRPRVLVVEDEVIVARDIAHQLQDLGYTPVGAATTGEDAIRLALDLRPDVVLMDIQLAGHMDGIAAAQAIRTRLALPVVFLTAFSADEVLSRAKLTEPFGYILKPFSERELGTVLAMAALGLNVNFSVIAKEGVRPMVSAITCSFVILALSWFIVRTWF